jgi:UDP-N-acetylmuramoyl-L-alanyl-D-glutamate--2,6-diaminopimelate ligase
VQQVKKLIRKYLPKPLLKIVEKLFRQTRGLYWLSKYRFPARGMRVIAVTGTNGKSTTCVYINEVLKAAGYKTATLTTVFYEFGGKKSPNKTHYTIDRQSIVQSFFARAKKSDVDFVILEVTSHALDQDRIMGVPVEIAVITNLTQDHLDYHGTMKNYARAKLKLLRNYYAKWAVLNADNKWYEYFSQRSLARVYSFGKKPSANAKLSSIKLAKDYSEAKLIADDEEVILKTNLLGEFNLYNAAAAASVGLILGLDPKLITKGIARIEGLSGRLEEINPGGRHSFKVFVDFAITPDAIKESLKTLKEIYAGKIRIVFGATGDRDKSKRQKMGEAAAKYADFIYLTDDETYTEDPEKIREEVYVGIKKAKAGKKTKIIADRGEAIKTAIKEAKKGDTVLITGLGHEDSRNMGGKHIPWRDQEVARKILNKNN